MTGPGTLTLLAAGSTAVAAGLVARWLVPPTRRLARRVRPYAVGARVSLGHPADPVGADPAVGGAPSSGTVQRLFAPVVEAVWSRFPAAADATGSDDLARRLRQARLLEEVAAEHRVDEFRLRVAAAAVSGAALALAVGLVLGLGFPAVPALGAIGAVTGGARYRARLDRAVEQRRRRLRAELYTVNQQVALHVRVGGGVAQALARVVARGRGELVRDLAEVLAVHASGAELGDALVRAADESPEPQVARTLRLLATGAEYGNDLADALLAHSDDVRSHAREEARRDATRRRAAMLLPTIAILAPVMLLFIAAPLPSLIFELR